MMLIIERDSRRIWMLTKCSIKILVFIFFLAVVVFQGFSQQTGKVAVVNSQKAFEGSLEGKKAMAQFRDKDDRIKKELDRMDNDIQALQTRINTQRLTLTDEALMQMASNLERKRVERKRYEEDSSREFQQLQIRLWQQIRNDVVPIIEQIAKEKGFELVLDLTAGGVVYANPACDITDEVIKKYDASKSTK